MKKLYIHIAIFFSAISVVAQKPLVANKQTQSISVTNVTIHVGNGTIIENGMVAFADGKFTYVGTPNKMKYDVAIDGGGKHLYPGFILMNSTIGLREIDAVRSTLDYDETGNITP